MTIFEHILNGCAPIPLAGYLKALGIFRLVAEQIDQEARGFWRDERFVVETKLGIDGLKQFFLEEYRPTAIIAPWNGGSGFFYREGKKKEKDPLTGKKLKTGLRDEPTEATRTLDRIATSTAARLTNLRQAVPVARAVIARHKLSAAPKGEPKDKLISELRAELPDEAVKWLDAVLSLTTDKTRYPPLMATGGTDGNLDFTTNFMQQLAELFDLDTGSPTATARSRLTAALEGSAIPSVGDAVIGQFFPGGGGGPNSGTGFEGEVSVNPWDLVFAVEGTLLFTGATTRRLEPCASSQLSYPFTVKPTGGGSGSATLSDEVSEAARAEIWMPLWSQATTLLELECLLSEGRATVGQKPARDGLDFVRSVARLGVDRGIDSFQRYGFFMRSGNNYLATPLNRIAVKRNIDADLIDDLDRGRWLDRFRKFTRRGTTPARLLAIARRLDDALFDMAQEATSTAIQSVLIALGEAVVAIAVSREARETISPPTLLNPRWVKQADDETDEFRLAAAIAGLGAGDMPLRSHLVPLNDKATEWDLSSSLAVWQGGPLVANLIAVLRRRLVEAERRTIGESQDNPAPLSTAPSGGSGAPAAAEKNDKPFGGYPGADLAAIAAFLDGATDDPRVSRLVAGLAWARMPKTMKERAKSKCGIPIAFAALKPLFAPDAQLRKIKTLPSDGRLPIPPLVVGRLISGNVEEALKLAQQRARASDLPITFGNLSAPPIDGRRLAAALVIPIDDASLSGIVERAYPKKSNEEIKS